MIVKINSTCQEFHDAAPDGSSTHRLTHIQTLQNVGPTYRNITIHYPSIDVETTVFLEQCQTQYKRWARTVQYRYTTATALRTQLGCHVSPLVTVITTELLSFNLHATDLAQRIDRRCSSTGSLAVSGRTELNGNRNKNLTQCLLVFRSVKPHSVSPDRHLVGSVCCEMTDMVRFL